MTRSHKLNDKDHAGLANGTAAPEEHLPRYFAKHGHVGEDPKKVKKSGGGKGNWLVSPLTPLLPFLQNSVCAPWQAPTGRCGIIRRPEACLYPPAGCGSLG